MIEKTFMVLVIIFAIVACLLLIPAAGGIIHKMRGKYVSAINEIITGVIFWAALLAICYLIASSI